MLWVKLCGDGEVERVQARSVALRAPSRPVSEAPAPYKTQEPDCLAQRIPVGSGHHLSLWFLTLLSP